MVSRLTWILGSCAVAIASVGIIYDQRSPLDYVSGVVSPAASAQGQPVPESILKGSNVVPAITLVWRRVDCDFTVTRMVRDGQGRDHKIPSDRPSVPPPARDIGKPLTSLRTIVVPNDALPGPNAHYRATLKFNCGWFGWIHPIVIEMPPIPFEIAAL